MDGSGVLLHEDTMTIPEESVDKSPQTSDRRELQSVPRRNQSQPIQAEMFGDIEMTPDLFSTAQSEPDEALLGDGEIRDIFQNERGIRVIMDRSRDGLLTVFGKATLTDRYLMDGESFQDLFEERLVLYEKFCDITVRSSNLTQDQVCEAIVEQLPSHI